MYKYFICYKTRTGKSYAEHLKKTLEESNANEQAFVAAIDILNGLPWEQERDNALKESKYFIIIITTLALDSPEIKKEYHKARKLGKRILIYKHKEINTVEIGEIRKLQYEEFDEKTELANKAIISIKNIESREKDGMKSEVDIEEFVIRGSLFINIGDPVEAIKIFEEAIKLKPNYARAWSYKGIALDNLGKYEEALDAYDKAIAFDPKDALVLHNKGITLDSLGRNEESLRYYNKAIELDPNNAEFWNSKSLILSISKHYDEALQAIDKAIELDDRFALAQNTKGLLLVDLHRYEEALEIFNKAIKLDASLSLFWVGRGRTLGDLKRYDKALETFDVALQLMPQDSYLMYNRSCIYLLKKDKVNALKDLSKAISLDAIYKEKAKKDEDFKWLWEDENFKRLIQ